MAMMSQKLNFTKLESAMRLFFQTTKNPQYWAEINRRSGVFIDRPAAFILHSLENHSKSGVNVHDLAHHLGIEAPSITRKTQELEALGLIKRSPGLTDRRVINLKLTPQGSVVANKLMKAQHEVMHQAFEQWSNGESQQFANLFERFSQDFAQILTRKTNKERLKV